jgi:hypothetical protein
MARLEVRVEEYELAAWKLLAWEERLSLSAWVRRRLSESLALPPGHVPGRRGAFSTMVSRGSAEDLPGFLRRSRSRAGLFGVCSAWDEVQVLREGAVVPTLQIRLTEGLFQEIKEKGGSPWARSVLEAALDDGAGAVSPSPAALALCPRWVHHGLGKCQVSGC